MSKKNRGKPKLEAGSDTKRVCVCIPATTRRAIDTDRRKAGQTISEWFRSAIDAVLSR